MISKFNNGFRFLFCVIDIYSKYAWVIPLKGKKGSRINNAIKKRLYESNRKPKKICGDKDNEFYNRSMESFLQNNDVEMYSMNNEGNSVVVERFIRTLKKKIYKYMTLISKNVYINHLHDLVNKFNYTCHSTT